MIFEILARPARPGPAWGRHPAGESPASLPGPGPVRGGCYRSMEEWKYLAQTSNILFRAKESLQNRRNAAQWPPAKKCHKSKRNPKISVI